MPLNPSQSKSIQPNSILFPVSHHSIMSPIAVDAIDQHHNPHHDHGHDHVPTHPTLLQVHRSPKAFSSWAISQTSLPAGAVFAQITTATPGPKAYTSVQTGRDSHIELNSDLVFINHSCDPSLVFDMHAMEVRVVDHRPLTKGDVLTFFYPSTEWEMAQPFECVCGAAAGVCKRWIRGAKDMSPQELEGYWLNPHIVEMKS